MTNKTMIYCSRCKSQEEPLTRHHYTHNQTGTTVYCYCHTCQAEDQRKKYAKNRKKMAQYVYDSIKRHPEKQRAREKLNYAVRSGKLERPTKCSHCGKESKRIEGAHHDYNKPLEVTWLCTPCHRQYDKRR